MISSADLTMQGRLRPQGRHNAYNFSLEHIKNCTYSWSKLYATIILNYFALYFLYNYKEQYEGKRYV